MKLRAPSIPIINIDPYFSIWAPESPLHNPVHWTGASNTILGQVSIDEKVSRFLGVNTQVPAMALEDTRIDACSTEFVYRNEAIRLFVKFTSPVLAEDLYYASRPVAYCKVSYISFDGQAHDVKVKFSCSQDLAVDKKRPGIMDVTTEAVDLDGISAIRMGSADQKVLWRSGDDIRIDWGYFYLGVRGKAEISCNRIMDKQMICAEASLQNDALFLFAYDDLESIEYFGDHLKAYWKKDGKTIEEAIAEAAGEYENLVKKCNAFSEKMKTDALEKGSSEYAELLMLAYRQIMAGHKLVRDTEGNNLYISKECFSNGCAATVDVTYPSSPMYLLYNPELLKGMLRPVMKYAASEEWPYDFAPHDVGQYPLVNGQVYSVDRRGEKPVFKDKCQMPVEECGNMIILFAALAHVENDASFAVPYLDILNQWVEYLLKYGAEPGNQLCTDDFAGHLANNVNLSIKATMGIASYSLILEKLGYEKKAAEMMKTAKEYAASLVHRSENPDGSYRLAFDHSGTFSLKYNAVWDKIFKTGLFPEKFYAGEMKRYLAEMNPYGVPLDSRSAYTKSDWLVWAASMMENKDFFKQMVRSLWECYNATESRVPMTDWYYTDTAIKTGFQHRTVQGGLFIKLLMD